MYRTFKAASQTLEFPNKQNWPNADNPKIKP